MEFHEKFKTYSNVELVRIIKNSRDYQPKAVETAKTILSGRQLSETEILIAENEVKVEKQQKREKRQKQIDERRIKSANFPYFNYTTNFPGG